jgi:hypothetical protein
MLLGSTPRRSKVDLTKSMPGMRCSVRCPSANSAAPLRSSSSAGTVDTTTRRKLSLLLVSWLPNSSLPFEIWIDAPLLPGA